MVRFAGSLVIFALMAPACSSDSDDDEEPAAGSAPPVTVRRKISRVM
jgi:hypothetical protein